MALKHIREDQRVIKSTIKPLSWLMALVFAWPATGAEQQCREITLSVTVPDSSWTITIDEIYRVGERLWVIAILHQSTELGIQVISTVHDSVEVCAPDLAFRYFVIGKTWHWKNDEPYTFLDNRNHMSTQLDTAKRIYRRQK